MKKMLFCLVCILIQELLIAQVSWQYKEIDSTRSKWGFYDEPSWLRYFGLDAADVNRDGYLDLVSGRYFYLNPGGDMMTEWKRTDLGWNADGCLFVDIDSDEYGDIIAMKYPSILWIESQDLNGSSWKATEIARVPVTGHVNGQGYAIADILPGDKPEILLSAKGGIYCLQITNRSNDPAFILTKIVTSNSDEGFAIADINKDGFPDIIFGNAYSDDKKEDPVLLQWARNPGSMDTIWEAAMIGTTTHSIDRIKTADLNNDGLIDIVVSEERYPGLEPDASLYWFKANKVENMLDWDRNTIVTQYSMNNLDLGDINLDGVVDVITSEHKGDNLSTQLWMNDGKGNFSMQLVDKGKEMHLGARLFDLDSDGDLDIVGHAWDREKYLHLWRNDLKMRSNQWKHISSSIGDLPVPNGGNQQTSSNLVDLDKDSIPEIIITERSQGPAIVALKYTGKTWDRIVIEEEAIRIEAGSAAADVDGDGDMDVIFGGDSKSNEVWWWENPFPKIQNKNGWKRHSVKSSGEKKHHDLMVDDFTGDGKADLVFWNQSDGKLFIADLPSNPVAVKDWPRREVYHYNSDSEMRPLGYGAYPIWRKTNEHEGLFAADIDGDGLKDILGGGRWFKYDGKNGFKENIIDASYTFTRVVAADFITGGRPEVILVAGDGHAPMVMYEYREGVWIPKTLIQEVYDGHTLGVIDFNNDGHPDIFTGEMRLNGGNPESVIKILLGNGKGDFIHQTVSTGLGIHEGRINDLDGDGDYDILVKPYNWEAPRIDILLNEN